MKFERQGNCTERTVIALLSISPFEQDHSVLRAIISSSWALLSADRLHAALGLLSTPNISVVLCERELANGTWVDLLKAFLKVAARPPLVVTSGVSIAKTAFETIVMFYGFHQVSYLRAFGNIMSF